MSVSISNSTSSIHASSIHEAELRFTMGILGYDQPDHVCVSLDISYGCCDDYPGGFGPVGLCCSAIRRALDELRPQEVRPLSYVECEYIPF